MADCDCSVGPYKRGYNPIWSIVDLAGLQADDTFYMWVLENEIPYVPAQVFHKTTGTPWTNPIQFLANGTLPVDIFWDKNKTYRLEIRKNIGPLPPSQADPLEYLVRDYRPGSDGGSGPGDVSNTRTSNQITNPQFSIVNSESYVLAGATNPEPIEVAPGWFLDLTGTGNVTIEQIPLSANASNPTNAPYALRILLSGAWIGNPTLRQRFYQNGMLWGGKYVSTSLTARIEGAPQAISVRMDDSSFQQLAILANPILSNEFVEYTGVALLPDSTNAGLPPAAYVDYKILLPSVCDIYITSVQAVASGTDTSLAYEQDTIQRQVDHTFHYYKPQLEYKPIPSALIGWDFPMNPAQRGESGTPTGLGVNTSVYAWDQTIVYQESSDSFSYGRGPNGCFRLTADVMNCQVAVIQYIEERVAKDILSGKMSVHLKAKTNVPGGLRGIVSIWYTSDILLPDMVLNRSLISSINPDGSIDDLYGNWVEVGRSLKNQGEFNINASVNQYTEFMLNGWRVDSVSDANSANYMAIVVGFESINTGQTIDLMSISLCEGDVATIPAPQSAGEVLRECQRYYETSYISPADVGKALVVDGALTMTQSASPRGEPSVDAYAFYQNAFCFSFNSEKYETPKLSLYSANTGAIDNVAAWVWGYGASFGKQASDKAVASFWSETISKKNANYTPAGVLDGFPFCLAIEDSVGIGWIEFHYVADSRLGIV